AGGAGLRRAPVLRRPGSPAGPGRRGVRGRAGAGRPLRRRRGGSRRGRRPAGGGRAGRHRLLVPRRRAGHGRSRLDGPAGSGGGRGPSRRLVGGERGLHSGVRGAEDRPPPARDAGLPLGCGRGTRGREGEAGRGARRPGPEGGDRMPGRQPDRGRRGDGGM
ncbi:MAG: 2-C-methyl-D-erythritol 2,4-cyclodiphosphate synthase, partial [uncultured Acidimicrobiales bacterium]